MADLVGHLRLLVGDSAGAATVYTAWQATHAYVVGDQRRPTVANGHFYQASVAGTSGSSQPTFPSDGGSVIDGTLVWEDQGAVPSGTSTFTDDELEAFLDERATFSAMAYLAPDTVQSGSSLVYRTAVRWWESDSALSDGSATLTASTTDALSGVWTFAAAPSSAYVSGRYFDMYGSATSVLQTWAAKLASEFDFGSGGLSFSRSQKHSQLLASAREYARKSIGPGMRRIEADPAWR